MTKSLEVAAKAMRIGDRIDRLDKSIAELESIAGAEPLAAIDFAAGLGPALSAFTVTADNAGAIFAAFRDALAAERAEGVARLAALGFAHAGPPQRGTAQELASYVPEGIRRGMFVDVEGGVQDGALAEAADQSRTAFLDGRV